MSANANVDGMVKEAIRQYRAGNKEEARTLLLKATELDDHHEQAWMWLSAVVESAEDQMICLENVLAINPSNADAQRGLDMLKAKQSALPKSNPFTNVEDEWGDIDADTSGFMSDLDLGIEARTPEQPKQSIDDLRSSIDENYQTGFESAFDSAVFGEDYDEETPLEDDFTEAELAEVASQYAPPREETPPPSAPPQRASAPVADEFDFDILGDAPSEADDGLDDMFDEDAFERELERELESLDDNISGDGESLQSFFAQIPTEIRPTRVPGADARYSPLLVPLLVVLVLGNIAAVALLVLNMA